MPLYVTESNDGVMSLKRSIAVKKLHANHKI